MENLLAENQKQNGDQNQMENTRYFKLPYIGDFSINTSQKLMEITKKFCKKGTSIKIALSPNKIARYFSIKDKKLENLQSDVVYKFTCGGCTSTYIGFTTRHLTTRIKEHLESDKKSHILKHINSSNNCKSRCSYKSFEVIDQAQTEYALKIKEAIWIK